MNEELKLLQERKKELDVIIADKNRLLFNAFSLARSEVFKKDPVYNWEYLRSIAEAFCTYLDELDAMGKHDLDLG